MSKIIEKVQRQAARYDELQRLLSDPAIAADPKYLREYGQELSGLVRAYRALGWQESIGSSGTVRAIESILHSALMAEPSGVPSSKKARRYQSPSQPAPSSAILS